MNQLLNPPAPPESRKTMKPRIELIGTTGYAIRIQEDKSGQLIELHADGEEVLADIPESTLDNWRSTGKGPPYLKIGVEPPEGHQDRRKVRYQRAVAERWASAHEYRRTVAR